MVPDKRFEISCHAVIRFLFYLCVIANYSLDLSEDYYLYGKVMMLIFMIASYVFCLIKGRLEVKQMLFPVLFSMFLALSFFWATNKEDVLAGAVTQFQYLLLAIAVYNSVRVFNLKKDYLYAVLISSFILAVLTIIKYGGLLSYLSQMIMGERLGGLLGNENTFGMTFSYGFVVCFYFFLNSRARIRVFYLICLVPLLLFAFSSQSKKALIMMVIGCLLLCVFRYGVKQIWKTILLIIVIAFALFRLLQLEVFSGIYLRMTSFFSGTDSSDLFRFRLIEIGISLFLQRPIAGWGYNSFRYVSGTGFYSHNNFVELLANLGLIGFSLYYCIFIKTLFPISRIRRKKIDSIYDVFFVLLTLDLIMGYGSVQFVEKTPWILFSVCFAVACEDFRFRSHKVLGEINEY